MKKKSKKDQIIKLYGEGMSKLGISKKVGVSRTYVYKVLIANGLITKQ